MAEPEAPVEASLAAMGQGTGRPLAAASPEARPLRIAITATLVGLALVIIAAPRLLRNDHSLTSYFLHHDLVALCAMMVVLGTALVAWRAPVGLFAPGAGAGPRAGRTALALAGGVLALTVVGTVILHGGFALSYDEVMAEFDARIFASGRLIAPVPPDWRAYVPALVPQFLLPVPGDAAWVSAYLPVNALLRAAFGAVAHPALTGPVLAAVAVAAIVGIARQLWPERPDAALVAGGLVATSPQVLVTATTSYAMTGHLALNLVWLWLFLRGGRAGHAAAAVIGVLACGLHQVVFHPLFVLPFLVGVVIRRRWRLAAFYLVVYAGAGLFWTWYWQGVLAVAGIGQGAAVGGQYLLDRIAGLLRLPGEGFDLMAKNLVRFVAWQSPLLVPLMLLAWPALRRGEGIARPAAAGLVLTTAAMVVLLPYQGHGWGYRYMHGLIGTAGLLGAQGWVTLTRSLDAPGRAAAWRAAGVAGAGALLVLLPFQGAAAYRFAAPYAAATAAIGRTEADFVVVDDAALVFGVDLVRNAPDLSNRPRVLLLRALDAQQVHTLCGRGTVAVFGSEEAARYGTLRAPNPDHAGSDARAALAEPGCRAMRRAVP